MAPTQKPILFTAFEPSGDALAARLIAELKRREPDRPIVALGGNQMRDAGAQLIETTTDHAVMGLGAVSQFFEHRRRVKRLSDWLAANPIAALVPTDSPAGNWAICAAVRKRQPEAKIVHLVAPQLWAWAPWRIRKLRRLTDRVLCLLPFEPDWFEARGVAGTFVGHPLYHAAARAEADAPPVEADAAPRLAVLPGSRRAEIQRNWPAMRDTALHWLDAKPGSAVRVALRREEDRALLGEVPEPIRVVADQTDAALHWAQVVLVVSGTATLQVAAHRRPMVALYRVNPLMWHALGRWLVRTRTFTLPNLIGQSLRRGRVIPELVPFFGSAREVTHALAPLMEEGEARQRQRAGLDAIAACFRGTVFADAAADALLGEIRD